MRIVEVVKYNPAWQQDFAIEAQKIAQALGHNCLAVHHIGSTAVPSLAAKPVIDIMPVVKNIDDVNCQALEYLGYTVRGELGMPFRIYAHKGGLPQHTHHLHIWEETNPEVQKHLMFRDYLIANPRISDEYEQLKIKLANQYRTEHANYTTGKDQFIKELIKKTGFSGLTIVQALHANEWQAYHRIKKAEIFDVIANITYDPNHPSITDPNHCHFVLSSGIEIVAISHIQMLVDNTAILRSLAVDKMHQHQGYGAYLLALMERWVRSQGKDTLFLHARISAEKFYRQYGYKNMEFNDISIDLNTIKLGKILITAI